MGKIKTGSVHPKKQKYVRAKKGAPRKWLPGPISNADQKEIDEIRSKISAKKSATKDVWNDYVHFCEENELTLGSRRSFISIAGAMKASTQSPDQKRRLKATSMLQKLTLLQDAILDYKRMLTLDEEDRAEPSFGEVMAIASLEAASVKVNHAPDQGREYLIHSLYSAPPSSCRTVAALMTLLGLRCADWGSLWSTQFAISSASVAVEVRVAKNRKNPGEVVTLRLLSTMPVWDDRLAEIITQGTEHARENPTEGEHLLSVTTTNLLAWCKKNFDKKVTTYTFRRSYIHAIIDMCTDEEGHTDYEKVSKYTLHFEEKTVRSAYAVHVSDKNFVLDKNWGN